MGNIPNIGTDPDGGFCIPCLMEAVNFAVALASSTVLADVVTVTAPAWSGILGQVASYAGPAAFIIQGIIAYTAPVEMGIVNGGGIMGDPRLYNTNLSSIPTQNISFAEGYQTTNPGTSWPEIKGVEQIQDKPWSLSVTLSGAVGSKGIGYTLGYFFGSNSSGLYLTKIIPDITKTSASLGFTLDASIYEGFLKSGEVEFGDIMGRGSEVAGAIGPIGISYAEPVPHFRSEGYRGFIPTYSVQQVSVGVGAPAGYAVWNSYTTPVFKRLGIK